MADIINSNSSKNEMRATAGNEILLAVTVSSLFYDKKIDLIKKVLLWEPLPKIHLPELKDRLNFINQVIDTSKASGKDMSEQHAQRVSLLETIIATMSPPISWADIFYSSHLPGKKLNQKECWLIEKFEDVQSDWADALVEVISEPVPAISENSLLLFDEIVRLGAYGIAKSLLAKKLFHPNDRVNINPQVTPQATLQATPQATPNSSRPIWYSALSPNMLELMFANGADLTQMKTNELGEKISFIKHWGKLGFKENKPLYSRADNAARDFMAKNSESLVKVLKNFWPDSVSEEVNKIWYQDLPFWLPEAAPVALKLLSRKGFKNGIRAVHDDQISSLSSWALRQYAPAAALSFIEAGIPLHGPLKVNNFIRVFVAFPLLTSKGTEARITVKDLHALEILWERYYPKDWQECDDKGRNLLGQLFSTNNQLTITPISINQDKIEFNKLVSERGQTTQLWLANKMIETGVDMFSTDKTGFIPAARAVIWAARGEKNWYRSRQVDVFSDWLLEGSKVPPTNRNLSGSADSLGSGQAWAGLKCCSPENLEKFWVSLGELMSTRYYRVMVKDNPTELHTSTLSHLKPFVKVLKKLFDTIPPPDSFWKDAKINDLIQDISGFNDEEKLKSIGALWLEKRLTAITNINGSLVPKSRVSSKI